MLGYLGSVEDVQFFKDAALQNYHGVFGGSGKDRALRALFQGLGLMARRGVKGADVLLKKMAEREYWQGADFQWHTDEVLEKKPELHRHDMTLRAVLTGLALAESEKELRDLTQAILDQIDDPKRHEFVKWLIDPDKRADYARRVRGQEAKPLSAFILRRIQTGVWVSSRLPDEPPPEPSPVEEAPLSEEDAAILRGTLKEARAAFELIQSSILQGEYEAVFPRLLDNGKLIEARKLRVRAIGAELAEDLSQVVEILQVLEDRQPAWYEYEIERKATWECRSVAEGPLLGIRSDIIILRAKLSQTADLGKKVGRAGRNDPDAFTVAEDGNLIVLLKKIDDEWRWNPFGW